MSISFLRNQLAAAAIAGAAATAAAADDFQCGVQNEFVAGPYYDCNATATPQKEAECAATNEENLKAAAEVFGGTQTRMNGNDMYICATWNNDEMGPLPAPAFKPFK